VIKELFKSLSYLIFPKLCLACMQEASLDNELFCVKCLYHLPISDMWDRKDNEFTTRLSGIEGLETGSALYRYYEGGVFSDILHRIKYKGRKDIATIFGRAFGEKLLSSQYYKGIDYLIPVPLHRKRIRTRGFNQSEALCKGLSETLGIPVKSDILLRIRNTKTQTKLNKSQRQSNLKDAFSVTDAITMKNKHILLVDDVLTTGSTIEECMRELRKHVDLKISVVTLAIRVYH